MLSYENRLKRSKNKIEEARLAYESLRLVCKHTRRVWKEKRGGYYCEVCERFLGRGET